MYFIIGGAALLIALIIIVVTVCFFVVICVFQVLKLKKYLGVNQIDQNYVIGYLNNLSPKKGFIFKNYCPDGNDGRKYFSNENGQNHNNKINYFKHYYLKNEN